MTDHWQPSSVQRRWKHIWIHGFVIGVGVVLIGFLVWFTVTETPLPSTSLNDGTAPEGQSPPGEGLSGRPPLAPQAPGDATAQLKSRLAQVLAGVKEANQKKDLPQLLSHYSPNFPKLQQRVQQISKTWKIYDYPKMDFEITQVKRLDDQTAVARVTWDLEAHPINALKNKHLSKTYLIRFARESGQWRIKAVDKAK
jgi:hypothetical protein